MILQAFTIIWNTFLQSVRQPIYVVLLFLCYLALLLNPSFANFMLSDDDSLLIDLSLSTILLAGLWISCLTSSNVLGKEIQDKTVLTVISKPIPRPLFILGKYLGVALAVILFIWLQTIVFMLTKRNTIMYSVRHKFDAPVLLIGSLSVGMGLLYAVAANYYYRKVFTSTVVIALSITKTFGWIILLFVDRKWQFQHPGTDLDASIIFALILLTLGIMVIVALSIAASTRVGQVMTIGITLVFFVIGLISSYFIAVVGELYPWATWPLQAVFPNLQVFWPGDRIAQLQTITFKMVGDASVYGLLLITAYLGIAMLLFQDRDVS